MPTLALLDGHSLAYRAFYALPPDLATQSGQVTNAAFGFTSMLIKLLEDFSPEGLVVAWDTGRSTFRTEKYPDYKAKREAAPDIFHSQLPLINEVLEAMRIPQVKKANYEADDVIATLARQAEADGWEVLVVTGDRDTFQLVTPRIKVVYTRRGITDIVVADEEWIKGKYGITPSQYLSYAALRGDPSDNLPGIPGVGEKTATQLVTSYQTLEGVFEHLDQHKPQLSKSLAEHREQVFTNRDLMQLVDQLELDIEDADLHRQTPNRAEVKKVFDRLEFATLWARLVELESGVTPMVGKTVEVEVGECQTAEQAAELSKYDDLVVEPVMEGTEIVGLILAPGRPSNQEEMQAFFVPDRLLSSIAPALSDPDTALSAHGAKQVVRYLITRQIEPAGLVFDSELAAYLINPAGRQAVLEDLAEQYLGVQLGEQANSRGFQDALDFSEVSNLEEPARRALVIRSLREKMEAGLEDREQQSLLRDMELPLVKVLARMELTGIRVDREFLEKLGEQLVNELEGLEQEIHTMAGEPFNINSTLQLRRVLFEALQLPVLKKTPKGAPSTDASVLGKLQESHPIASRLVRYREIEKLYTTYVKGYLPLIEPDGRIHAHFNQTTATTGRLSSEHPNLQNIPVRSETGHNIRRAFIPRPGWVFVVADYSQIELRVLAHLSEDPGLIAAFQKGEDIHAATAAGVFNVPVEAVTPELRRRAKGINFGLLYGMEAFGLADRLEISTDEASQHRDDYFEQFPKVRDYMQNIVTQARKTGYTTTIFGRRRYFTELTSTQFRERQMGQRMALNAPMQGSAADIIKLAMVELDRRLPEVEASLLLQIHDELVLECAKSSLEKTMSLVVEVMEGVVTLNVPLTVDIATGADLASVKK